MKSLSIIAVIILASVTGYSQFTCATSFKVNNGNGTCGAAGELRLNFPGGCPALLPFIDSVYVNGEKGKVTFFTPDVSNCGGKNGYVSYCVSSGNMPPANAWNIFFHDTNGQFNCTVVSTSGGVLAVKFNSFNAALAGNAVTCNWTTESEINTNHYELERSFDGNSFGTAAIIFTAENTTAAKNNYSYRDNSTPLQNKSMVFYRVKEVDTNGAISYSKIINIKLGNGYSNSVETSPNPFAESMSVKFDSNKAGVAEINILSSTGQPVAVKNGIVFKGSNSLQVGNLSGLSKGIYVVQVSINGVIAGNQKVIKN
ncbi:MAG: hypothetical protein JWR61_5747 [Ferruginibacter sp.]|uniref:T9SS type A sorting domain-containing protein n=1 Tax=Ferruginibacter sp. TaxID=1940288 RepID=UPI002657FCA3|nr:T9SS type A sorting domain-containing protein [Ferruginibacter sp.]MDB5280792.1 hypothetical protein [Ferruginibacter sp.]